MYLCRRSDVSAIEWMTLQCFQTWLRNALCLLGKSHKMDRRTCSRIPECLAFPHVSHVRLGLFVLFLYQRLWEPSGLVNVFRIFWFLAEEKWKAPKARRNLQIMYGEDQWIGLRENLEETINFSHYINKIQVCLFRVKPSH